MKRSTTTRITFFLLSLISFTALFSCKEDTIIDANLVPAGDTINSIIIPDTLTIYTKTILDDSAVTGDSIYIAGVPINHAMGTIATDPYSGKTTAGIFFQVIQPSLNFTFPVAPDSAVLILPYARFTWGDTTVLTPQTFNVHEVTGDFPKNKIYTSKSDVAYDPQILGSTTITSYDKLDDSVTDLGANKQAHLRIKLNDNFLNKIKNANTSTNLNSYANFLSYFKGFYIEPSSTTTGNALFYIQMISSSSATDYNRANVLFYYTESGTVKTKSFFYDPTYAARFNKISRDYTGSPTNNLFTSTNATDSIFVIQNEPGAALDVVIPYVKNLPQRPINKAELIITQYSFTGDGSDKYFSPSRLYPTRVNSDGTTQAILDRYPLEYTEPLLFIDGEKRTVSIAGITYTQYVINIPREVQRTIIEKRDKLHLRIAGASGYPGAYRLIGTGRTINDANLRIKLNIVFSKI